MINSILEEICSRFTEGKDLAYFLKESLVKGQKHFAIFKMEYRTIKTNFKDKGTSMVSSLERHCYPQ